MNNVVEADRKLLATIVAEVQASFERVGRGALPPALASQLASDVILECEGLRVECVSTLFREARKISYIPSLKCIIKAWTEKVKSLQLEKQIDKKRLEKVPDVVRFVRNNVKRYRTIVYSDPAFGALCEELKITEISTINDNNSRFKDDERIRELYVECVKYERKKHKESGLWLTGTLKVGNAENIPDTLVSPLVEINFEQESFLMESV